MDSYKESLKRLGKRARGLRLLSNFKQSDLARRAGVGLMTVRRFEQTGKASIENVLRIAHALRVESGFDELFKEPEYESLDEALDRPRKLERQRVRRAK